MKDLDFDELDRAVNSLMADVKPDTPEPNKEVSEKTLSIGSSSQPSASSTDGSSAPSAPPPAVAPLATRRNGRFMDVMHPSHDMKQTQPQKVSREGTGIAPTVDSPIEPTTTEASIPKEELKPDAPKEIEPPKSDWPDPLDMEQPAPLTSPFLPDAKVEKRPLGGQSPAQEPEPSDASTSEKSKLTIDNPDDQLPPAPKEVEQPLPEELQNDLVAIESGSSGIAPAIPPAAVEEPPEEESKPIEEPDKKEPPKESPAYIGPTSIPQQYKEEPNTNEQQPGAIYDTDTYHQPLAHPAKKKSGWMWVIWILLIIILGSAIGAALYFFGII